MALTCARPAICLAVFSLMLLQSTSQVDGRRHNIGRLSAEQQPDSDEGASSEQRLHGVHRRLFRHRRHQEQQPKRLLGSLDSVKPEDEGYSYADLDEILRGKRNSVQRPWTDKDRKAFLESRIKNAQIDADRMYEVEVREAQNSSLCNYTVIPIPDPGGRIPAELEHVKCNHAGSRCQDKGTYCCLQTYRNIEVSYTDGSRERMKIYSGCVCSLQIYGTLEPYLPALDLND